MTAKRRPCRHTALRVARAPRVLLRWVARCRWSCSLFTTPPASWRYWKGRQAAPAGAYREPGPGLLHGVPCRADIPACTPAGARCRPGRGAAVGIERADRRRRSRGPGRRRPGRMGACAAGAVRAGDPVFYAGPPGMGVRAKLATNLVLGLNRAVFAEGLSFARALGIPPRRFSRWCWPPRRHRKQPGQGALDGRRRLPAAIAHSPTSQRRRPDAERGRRSWPRSSSEQRARRPAARTVADGDGDLDNAAIPVDVAGSN